MNTAIVFGWFFFIRIWALFWLIFGIRPRWIYAKRFYANIKIEHWICVRKNAVPFIGERVFLAIGRPNMRFQS